MRLPPLLTAVALLLSAGLVHAATIGAPAPAFSAIDSHGETHSLSDFAGKTVVLEWTNHGCPFVQKHYQGNMQSLQAMAADGGAVWLSVISSAPGKQGHVSGEEANALTTERDAAPTAVLFDPSGEIGRRYDAKTTPHMYVINAEGTLVYAGGIDSIPSADPADIDDAEPYFRTALAETLAGKAVSRASTRPYGCSIKY